MADTSVWIVNKGSHPYHHAERFGQLRVLTEGRVNVFAVDNLADRISTMLREGANQNDLVLISGYAIPNGITMSWFMKKYGRVRMLIWGATQQEYTVVTLSDSLVKVE